ncbi:MAG: Clp protease N-terminal domain-containing protein [Actinocatenispora sp.]
MFERFTKEARAAVVMAQEEARALRHEHTGTEHVLLGILTIGTGPAYRALHSLGVESEPVRQHIAGLGGAHDDDLDADALATVGIDLAEVRRATEETFGPGALDRPNRPLQGGHIPFDPAAKKSLELAVRETLRHKSSEITNAHMLLGVLRAEPNPATVTLRAFEVDLTALRDALERELRDPAA